MEEKYRKYTEMLLEKAYEENDVINKLMSLDDVSKAIKLSMNNDSDRKKVDRELGEVVQNIYNIASIIKSDSKAKKTAKKDIISICNYLTFKSYLKKVQQVVEPIKKVKNLKNKSDIIGKAKKNVDEDNVDFVDKVIEAVGPNNTIYRIINNPESFFLKATGFKVDTNELNKLDRNLGIHLGISNKDQKKLRNALREKYGVTIASNGVISLSDYELQKKLKEFIENYNKEDTSDKAIGYMIVNPNMFSIGDDGQIIYSPKSKNYPKGMPSADMFLVLPYNDKEVYNLYIYKKWQSISSIADMENVILSNDKNTSPFLNDNKNGGRVAILDGEKWEKDPKGASFINRNKDKILITRYYLENEMKINKIMNTSKFDEVLSKYSENIRFLITDGTGMLFHGNGADRENQINVNLEIGNPGEKASTFKFPLKQIKYNIFSDGTKTGNYAKLDNEKRNGWTAQLGTTDNDFNNTKYNVTFASDIANPIINCNLQKNQQYIKFVNKKEPEKYFIYKIKLKTEKSSTNSYQMTSLPSVFTEENESNAFKKNFKKYFATMRNVLSSSSSNEFTKKALENVDATEKYLKLHNWKPNTIAQKNIDLDLELEYVKTVDNNKNIALNKMQQNQKKVPIMSNTVSEAFNEFKESVRKNWKSLKELFPKLSSLSNIDQVCLNIMSIFGLNLATASVNTERSNANASVNVNNNVNNNVQFNKLPKEVQETLKKVANAMKVDNKKPIKTFDDVKNLDRNILKTEANNIRNRK